LTDPACLQRGMLLSQEWSAKNDNLGWAAVSSYYQGRCVITLVMPRVQVSVEA